jgi:hypothetical protein
MFLLRPHLAVLHGLETKNKKNDPNKCSQSQRPKRFKDFPKTSESDRLLKNSDCKGHFYPAIISIK